MLVLIACICSLIFVKSAGYLLLTGKVLKKGMMAEARIIGKEKRSFLHLIYHCPIIEFTTSTGKKIRGSFKPVWLMKLFTSNQKIMVMYNPRRPSQFFIDDRNLDVANFTALALSVSALLFLFFKIA